mgnify:CR=1 FL=1
MGLPLTRGFATSASYRNCSKSAAKAVAQGYTNVKLFQAGYPAWKQAYGASEAPAQAAASAELLVERPLDTAAPLPLRRAEHASLELLPPLCEVLPVFVLDGLGRVHLAALQISRRRKGNADPLEF